MVDAIANIFSDSDAGLEKPGEFCEVFSSETINQSLFNIIVYLASLGLSPYSACGAVFLRQPRHNVARHTLYLYGANSG
jgi:hypothetical protein